MDPQKAADRPIKSKKEESKRRSQEEEAIRSKVKKRKLATPESTGRTSIGSRTDGGDQKDTRSASKKSVFPLSTMEARHFRMPTRTSHLQ